MYTAGAIVTVTVTLVRRNMSTLFGDDTVQDKHCAVDEKPKLDSEVGGDGEGETKEKEQACH